MADFEMHKSYADVERIESIRIDYAHALERLDYFADHHPGRWTLVALAPNRKPAARLKERFECPDDKWWILETFTRLERPRADGRGQWHEIWARITK